MSLTQQLAEAIASLPGKAASPATVEAAKKAFADTVACMLAGAPEASIAILRRLAQAHGGPGRCSAIGRDAGLDPRNAALINGTAGHALDYDDVLLLMPGHPSVAVLPAVLAVAEDNGASGAELLQAYIAGVEMCGRFGDPIRVTHYKRGWHATGTIGAFGALAGVATLLRLKGTALTHAIGILTSLLGGVQRNFGTMTKPLHAGQGAANAVWAALAAREGFTADRQILESPGGFFEVFNGPIPQGFGPIDALLAPSVFESPGLALKRFPCNYALHRNVDAFQEAMASKGLRTTDIEKIECLLPPGETRPIMRARPDTGLEAKFSLEYVLAAVALDGTLGFDTFTDEAVRRPEIASFLPRIEKRESEECAGAADSRMKGGIGQGKTRVIVTARDGRRAVAERAYPKGAPEEPLSWDEIGVKFRDCARHGGFDEAQAASLLQWLRGLNDQPTLEPLAQVLRRPVVERTGKSEEAAQ